MMQHSWLLCTLEGSLVKCPFAQQHAHLCPHNTYTKDHQPSITRPPWNCSTARKWHQKITHILFPAHYNWEKVTLRHPWISDMTAQWGTDLTLKISKHYHNSQFHSSSISLKRFLRRREKNSQYPATQLNTLLIVCDYNTFLFQL